MVICLFAGCTCSPCVRSRSPMGNSLVLLQAIRDLFPVWDVSAEQALRAWILSMPSAIRARLDALSLDELQQLSGASPPPPATATVYTQTVRLFMPRSLSPHVFQQSHNTACSPPQRRLRRQFRCLAFLGTPRPLFLLRRGQVLPLRRPSSLLRSLVPPPRGLFSRLLSLLRSLVPLLRGLLSRLRSLVPPLRGLLSRLRSLVPPPRGLLSRPRSLVWLL